MHITQYGGGRGTGQMLRSRPGRDVWLLRHPIIIIIIIKRFLQKLTPL